MAAIESVVTFPCQTEHLIGILHAPQHPVSTGVLIIVGGPQYRTGSHRFFTLTARHLAQLGYPVFRFDYRGMGDSTGAPRNFEDIDDDIRSALDAFSAASPQVTEFVLWGLCDAASAAIFYAGSDPRVRGIVMLNPWVRTTQSQAQTYLKHYYLKRFVQAEFWRKLFTEKTYFLQSIRSVWAQIKLTQKAPRESTPESNPHAETDLPTRMLLGLQKFKGQILIILSGNDLTAKEFIVTTENSRDWQQLMAKPHIRRCDLPAADHTFSSRLWRDQVAEWTIQWLEEKERRHQPAEHRENMRNSG